MKMNAKHCKPRGLMGLLAMVARVMAMGGCTSNVHRPEIAEATRTGVFFLDLRRSLESAGEAEREKKITAELLANNCKLPVNVKHPVCLNPSGFSL